jgi:hypothetical protein
MKTVFKVPIFEIVNKSVFFKKKVQTLLNKLTIGLYFRGFTFYERKLIREIK